MEARPGPPWRVVSLPPRHAYVDAVTGDGVLRVRSDRVAGWEPDPLFAPGAVAGVAGAADLVHLHFGFDHLEPDDARRWVAELAAARLPLVLTVHDLRNPHHAARTRHDAVLAVLVAAAAAVLTLTAGAAAEIRRRFGRAATVLPHPTLLGDPGRSAHVVRDPGLVTLHLKSLRSNLQDPVALVRAAAAGAAGADGRLRVDLHPEVADDPRLADLQGPAAPTGAELRVHPRFSDLALECYLRGAAVTVLPHRWGTHSGWLELARDLGTRVVAPDGGRYGEQWDEVVSYGNNEDRGLDPDSLSAAVGEALRRPPPLPADRAVRLAARERTRAAHADLYATVVAAGRADG